VLRHSARKGIQGLGKSPDREIRGFFYPPPPGCAPLRSPQLCPYRGFAVARFACGGCAPPRPRAHTPLRGSRAAYGSGFASFALPAPAAGGIRPRLPELLHPSIVLLCSGSFSPAPPRPAAPAGGSGEPGASWLAGSVAEGASCARLRLAGVRRGGERVKYPPPPAPFPRCSCAVCSELFGMAQRGAAAPRFYREFPAFCSRKSRGSSLRPAPPCLLRCLPPPSLPSSRSRLAFAGGKRAPPGSSCGGFVRLGGGAPQGSA
jgi:hypothetical protein